MVSVGFNYLSPEQLQAYSEVVQDLGLSIVMVLIITFIVWKFVAFVLDSIKTYAKHSQEKSIKILELLSKTVDKITDEEKK